MASRDSGWLSVLSVVGGVIGIYSCHLSQGVAQESIYRLRDVESGKLFAFPFFLVSTVCTISGLLGYVIIRLQHQNSITVQAVKQAWKAPYVVHEILRQGMYVSITYLGAMFATHYSLTRVNYITQILMKSAKAVPVIVGGYVFFGKRYHYSDYITVASVTCSLMMFQYSNLANSKNESTSTWVGFLALCVALVFDGMTGPRQDRMVERWHVSTADMMLLINGFAAPIGWAVSLLCEGTGPYGMLWRNMASLLPRVIIFTLCGAAGQVFVVYILRTLGSLHLTLITTSRKFLAILISVALYRHKMSSIQWFSVLLLFASGFFKYFFNAKSPPAPRTAEDELELREGRSVASSISQRTQHPLADETASLSSYKHENRPTDKTPPTVVPLASK